MKITLARQDSKGITGTLRNARHHAQPCIPLIKEIRHFLEKDLSNLDFEWKQGHNVHKIISNNRTLVLRPFRHNVHGWGIDVLIKTKEEARIMTVTNKAEMKLFLNYLVHFINLKDNHYCGE